MSSTIERVQIGDCTLYHGDCREVLPTLAPGSVDAVVTDPPYGIGYKYESGTEATKTHSEYESLIRPIVLEANRVIAPGGLLAFWQSHKHLRFAWEWFGDDCVVYAACKNFVQMLPSAIQLNGFDPVVMRYASGAKPRKAHKPRRSLNWSLANTANMSARGIEKGHPCPRPIEHANEIIGNFCIDDGVVLDPFMGSGTTGVACVRLGRKFIGIELEKRYFDIACERTEKAYADKSGTAGNDPTRKTEQLVLGAA